MKLRKRVKEEVRKIKKAEALYSNQLIGTEEYQKQIYKCANRLVTDEFAKEIEETIKRFDS